MVAAGAVSGNPNEIRNDGKEVGRKGGSRYAERGLGKSDGSEVAGAWEGREGCDAMRSLSSHAEIHLDTLIWTMRLRC